MCLCAFEVSFAALLQPFIFDIACSPLLFHLPSQLFEDVWTDAVPIIAPALERFLHAMEEVRSVCMSAYLYLCLSFCVFVSVCLPICLCVSACVCVPVRLCLCAPFPLLLLPLLLFLLLLLFFFFVFFSPISCLTPPPPVAAARHLQ